MSQNVPKPNLKKAARLRRVIELRAQGGTIDGIAKALDVSEKTVDRDLRGEDIKLFVDELIRQQLTDIVEAKLGMRLRYRDRLLDKLLPRKIEQKGEVEQSILIRGWGLDIAKGDNAKLQAAPEPSAVPP
jgi:IS30 family transposase